MDAVLINKKFMRPFFENHKRTTTQDISIEIGLLEPNILTSSTQLALNLLIASLLDCSRVQWHKLTNDIQLFHKLASCS